MDSLEQAAERVALGDDAAFDVSVASTSARLLRLAARLMGSIEEGEDVLQDAYIRAHRSLADGAFDRRARVETWIQRIVTNAAIDALRARRRRPAAPVNDVASAEPACDGASLSEARLALAELDAWLGDLPGDQRTALTLKAVEEMSSSEIADSMGLTEGAVEQLLARARSALRKKRDSHDA